MDREHAVFIFLRVHKKTRFTFQRVNEVAMNICVERPLAKNFFLFYGTNKKNAGLGFAQSSLGLGENCKYEVLHSESEMHSSVSVLTLRLTCWKFLRFPKQKKTKR